MIVSHVKHREPLITRLNEEGHGDAPFSLQVENFNGSNEAGRFMCGAGFKRLALVCRNTNHRRGCGGGGQNIRCKSHLCLSYTLHCCQLPSSLHHNSLLAGSSLSFSVTISLTIALFGLIEEYETAWRDIAALSPTDMPIHFAAGDLTS